MKKALSMLLAGTMAMSLVACSSGNSSSSTTADTTAAAAADTKSEGGDTAADTSEDYGDYSWNLAKQYLQPRLQSWAMCRQSAFTTVFLALKSVT